MNKNYEVLNELVPKTQELHRAIFDKGYEQGQRDVLDKIKDEIIERSIEDYKYHGCGTDELIIETSEVLRVLDKYKAGIKGEEV